MDTPQDVARALELLMFREQIAKLNQALSATEALQQEAEQMQTVDFDRYAKIIVLLPKGSSCFLLLHHICCAAYWQANWLPLCLRSTEVYSFM